MQLSKKQIGVLWMSIPFFVLTLVLSLYAISSYIMMATVAGGTTEAGGFSFLRILLGIFGFLSMTGAVIGIPVGLYFFSRVEPHEVSDLARKTAYEGLSHEQVEYIAKWSWSAFFMHWIWTLCNRGVRFWTLGFFAPLVQQYLWIKIAMHGRRMTWESGKWKSFKEFRKRQRILAWTAWALAVISIVLASILLSFLPKLFLNAVVQDQSAFDAFASRSAMFEPASRSTDVKTSDVSPFCQGLEDIDRDGLIDQYEIELNADPKLQDTDGDGFTDGEELENGYDPGGPGVLSESQRVLYPIEKGRAERCL